MLASLATLAFLTTLWLIAVVALDTLAHSGRKIMSALAGRSELAMTPATLPAAMRIRPRVRVEPPMRARPRLRAAA